MITSSSSSRKKSFLEAVQALSDVSKLLSRLCKSRKTAMKLQEIIGLTGVTARLARALSNQGSEQDNDGYGNPSHLGNMSELEDRKGIIR